jgi:hypothetical protein
MLSRGENQLLPPVGLGTTGYADSALLDSRNLFQSYHQI